MPKEIDTETLTQAPDMEVIRQDRKTAISEQLAQAPDLETLIEKARATISAEIPISSNKQVIQEPEDIIHNPQLHHHW